MSADKRLRAIWSPSDFEQAVRDAQAVVKAGQRSHHLTPVADSERVLRMPQLLSQSRFRKARIYDALAVALMLATPPSRLRARRQANPGADAPGLYPPSIQSLGVSWGIGPRNRCG